MTMNTRREFVCAGAAAALAGCTCMKWGRSAKFAMNASTLRGYKLSLAEQVKAVAEAGFAGFEPWMKDIRAAKAAGTLGVVRQSHSHTSSPFMKHQFQSDVTAGGSPR